MYLRSFLSALPLLLPALAFGQKATANFTGTVQFVQSGVAYPASGSQITGAFVFDYSPSQNLYRGGLTR